MDISSFKENTMSYQSGNRKLLSPVESDVSAIDIDHSLQQGESLQDDVLLITDEIDQTKCSKCLRFLRTLTIEPAAFLYLFGFMLNMSCTSNLMMDKGCLYYFNYSQEVCTNLSAHDKEKTQVEVLSNNYGLYSSLMSLFAALAMTFIAPWSDKYGRKLPLVLTCIGTVISDLGTIMCVIYFDSSLNYLILVKFPSEVVGGIICFLTIVYSHASEVSTEENRTLKYTTVGISLSLAMSLGGFTGGMIYRYYGYFYVYLTGMILHFLCIPWVELVVKETAGSDVNAPWKQKVKDFFKLDSLSSSWKAVARQREKGDRAVLWMYLLSMCIIILTYEVLVNLGYVYAHHIYNWNPTMYNSVNTVFSLAQFVIMTITTPLLLKVFKISDPILGIVGSLSMMGKNFVIAFAQYDKFIYYTGTALGFFNSLSSLAIRAGISKIIHKEETGLVFAFLATCEQIFPIIGVSIFTVVFNFTINIFPSITYLVSVVFLFIPIGTFLWVFSRSKRESLLG